MSARILRQEGPLAVYAAPAGGDQAYVTASVGRAGLDPGEAAAEAYGCIGAFLAEQGMGVLLERVFGSLSAEQAVGQARARALEARGLRPDWPVTYVEGRPPWGPGLAGVQVWAVRPSRPGDVRTVRGGGGPVGRVWERGGFRFVVLQNVRGLAAGPGGRASRGAEAERTFERAAALLQEQGGTFADVVRTWIYLSDILDWYAEFNAARNAQYERLGLMPGGPAGQSADALGLPASTGIGGANPFGAACLMDALAIVGDPGRRPRVTQLSNARQMDAFRYGSAFSRGARIEEAGVTSIHVSGTAAIDELGRSACPGDVRQEVLWTLDCLEALLGQQGASAQDICQATVFLKRPEDLEVFRRTAAERGLAGMPAVCVLADVCRAECSFEMDGVAAVAR